MSPCSPEAVSTYPRSSSTDDAHHPAQRARRLHRPYVLRAGELFFRAQKASLRDGALLLADLELIEEQARDREALRHVSPLTMMLGGEPGDDLDVMDDANAWTYWSRSDANSMVLNLGTNPAARAGLARVIAAWVEHLTGARVSVEPVAKMEDRDWRWFVGLDAEGTRIGNAIWSGEALPPEDVSSIAALFGWNLQSVAGREKVRGKPVWLLLGMTPDKVVRMKPQNLLVGLAPCDRARSARERPMSGASREVGVVLRRSKVDHAWIDHVWSPEAILPDVPAAAPGTKLGMAGESALFYAGPARIELYPSETANYRDNLIDGHPQVWVALRKQSETGEMELVQVTADPTEGETLAGGRLGHRRVSADAARHCRLGGRLRR